MFPVSINIDQSLSDYVNFTKTRETSKKKEKKKKSCSFTQNEDDNDDDDEKEIKYFLKLPLCAWELILEMQLNWFLCVETFFFLEEMKTRLTRYLQLTTILVSLLIFFFFGRNGIFFMSGNAFTLIETQLNRRELLLASLADWLDIVLNYYIVLLTWLEKYTGTRARASCLSSSFEKILNSFMKVVV